jgi:hypothetical protein
MAFSRGIVIGFKSSRFFCSEESEVGLVLVPYSPSRVDEEAVEVEVAVVENVF